MHYYMLLLLLAATPGDASAPDSSWENALAPELRNSEAEVPVHHVRWHMPTLHEVQRDGHLKRGEALTTCLLADQHEHQDLTEQQVIKEAIVNIEQK